MTTKAGRADNSHQRRDDRNAEIRVLAVNRLQQLLKVLCDPVFRGSLQIEIHAKDGTLGSIRTKLEEFNEPR